MRPTSNGEVEGPDDHASQAPRAHNFSAPEAPNRKRISRTPRTIVRWPLGTLRVS
jgi:hypothetical protein